MSGSDRRTALRVLLILLGVCAGWALAGYAFLYFTWIGVPSGVATGYSIFVGLIVLGAIWLMAFKVNLRK